MCNTPRTFEVERVVLGEKRYEEITVACRECWQCRERWISDITGRGLAEAWSSHAVAAVTLTYAPRDDGAEKIVTKQHAQDFIRKVRRRGHRLRYIIVSERGEKYGRVHFHAVLFFKTDFLPSWENRRNINCDTWPHGLMYVDWGADDRALRYALKYTFKNSGELRNWRSMSLKPAIGHEWFMAKAETLISAGVMPKSFTYAPPNARPGKSYLMSGTTRRNYINKVMEGLRAQGKCPVSISNEMVHDACESGDKWVIEREEREYIKSLSPSQLEEHFSEEWKLHMKRKADMGFSPMTDLQAERYLHRLAIACCIGQLDPSYNFDHW